MLTNLAERLTADDSLLLFLIDHGGSDGRQQSYAWMWNSERLYDLELATLLNAFHVASMVIVIGTCHSGGFIDDLRGENRIIVTSCAESEQSWACNDRPYDEFVYQWTCAIAGHDTVGNTVNADSNGDGYVSMAEAFYYAQQNDRREETPQYCSMPALLGELWTLSPELLSDIGGEKTVNCRSINTTYFDLQGRVIPTPSGRKIIKKINAKQSFLHSPIIIIKP